MKIYLKLLTEVLENGWHKPDRTGTGVRSLFGKQIRFDLNDGFPLLTTKKVFFKGIIHELLWFLKGSDNIEYLKSNSIHIWDEWADENGEVGPIYGYQWRKWQSYDQTHIDQIEKLIESLKQDPYSRRHIVSAWNVAMLDEMSLPPCHCLFQFYVGENKKLSCHLYQRSADIFLGVPFNIASYALLTHLIANCCDFKLGELVISFGDLHLYQNHIEQAKEQIKRMVRKSPSLYLNKDKKNIFSFEPEDIKIQNYDPHPSIKAAISV